MPGEHHKHTPIVSGAQRGLFGAELRRRKRGLTPRMKGITTEELRSHLRESRGKKLPARTEKARSALGRARKRRRRGKR